MSVHRRVAIPGLLGFAAALLLPFAPSPARAEQSALAIQMDSPGDGATVSGTFTPEISGSVYTGLGANVDAIHVQVIRSSDGHTTDHPLCCANPRTGTVPFSMSAPALTRNGVYTARVTATGHFLIGGLEVSPQTAQQSFAVAVPPAPPTLSPPQVIDKSVKLTWAPGRVDPDLMGYAVYRKVGSGAFQPLKGVAANVTTYTDDATPAGGGAVQYRVDALRQGAVYSNNANDWLSRPSTAVVANLPVPPTTAPSTPPDGSSTTAPGGGASPEGAVNNTDLGSLFGSGGGGGGGGPSFPTPTLPAAIPDPGFSQLLPFPSTPTGPGGKVDGRQQAPPANSSGSAALDADDDNSDLDDSNRRALLVPVAGGSVLCVAALHLRWLNRRLGMAAVAGASAGGPGGTAAGGDLEPADPDPDAFAPDREPIGAGSGAGRARG